MLSSSLQADPDSKIPTLLNSQKILLPFGPSRAMPWWITNITKCPATPVLWTSTCMWCNIQYQFAEFYKGKIYLFNTRKFFPLCMIQLTTSSWFSVQVLFLRQFLCFKVLIIKYSRTKKLLSFLPPFLPFFPVYIHFGGSFRFKPFSSLLYKCLVFTLQKTLLNSGNT